jgi:hypothetical protein
MAIFGLALVGSACAASSRNMFGGSASPTLPPTIKTINERNRIAPVPRSAQRPPARSTTWPRVKSNQPTIGPPKAAPRPPLPRASAPATPPAGQADRTKRCRAQRWLRILLRLVLPSPPRRSAPANRMAQTSQLLRRTTSIWPPFLSHTPMRTALRL